MPSLEPTSFVEEPVVRLTISTVPFILLDCLGQELCSEECRGHELTPLTLQSWYQHRSVYLRNQQTLGLMDRLCPTCQLSAPRLTHFCPQRSEIEMNCCDHDGTTERVTMRPLSVQINTSSYSDDPGEISVLTVPNLVDCIYLSLRDHLPTFLGFAPAGL